MDEKIIAIHEAGHAVIARVLGISVTQVTMFPTDGKGSAAGAQTGSASWLANEADRADQIRAAENDAKVCLAGPHAQQKYRPSKLKHRMPAEWRDDFELAKQFVVKAVLLGTDPAFNLPTEGRDIILSRDASAKVVSRFDQVSTDVKSLVADNWPAIERTAEELLRLRIISGKEVDAIMNKYKSYRPDPTT
jgi:ATP-dependent Zn protease